VIRALPHFDREPSPAAVAILICLIALTAAVATDKAVAPVAAITVLVASCLLAGVTFLARWDVLLAGLVGIVLFVPIKRYKLPGNLPFDLELYRIVIAFIVVVWVMSLLVDRRVVLRRTFLDVPLIAIGFAMLGSFLTNLGRISGQDQDPGVSTNLSLADEVTKAVLLFVSIIVVFYLVASLIDSHVMLHRVVTVLVVGSTVVAVFAIVEARTQFNIFNHVSAVLPFLSYDGSIAGEISRGGVNRVYASAQSPIALGALFVMVIPLALYLLNVTHRRIWWGVIAILGLGALSSLSRTGVVMSLVVVVAFCVLRLDQVKRFLPLIVPALVVVHFALPGAIGGYRQAFFPSQGIVEDQTVGQGRVSSERLDPQFAAIRNQPFFGVGYGTRLTDGPNQNAFILDDQWLGTTVETGILGMAAWVWFFLRFVRKTGGAALRDPTPRGLLLTGLAAAMAAFAVSMLTYDTFSFIQVTVVMFILAAIGVRALDDDLWPGRARRPASADGLPRTSV
jgi:hypothetical protein